MNITEQEFVDLARQSRMLLAALVLASLWVAEAWAPMFPGRQRRLSHAAVNLGLAALNAAIAYGLALGILTVVELATRNHFGLIRLVPMPNWLQWLAAIMLFDCWQYWWHRLNHRVAILWRFHAVHHADADMDASTGIRFHTVEMLFSFFARLAVVPLIGMSGSQLIVYEAISLPVILFHHSNICLPASVDRSLRWLIVTPWMHFVHHSRWRPETNSNYSSFLSIWDRLFGSFRLRDDPREISLGLDDWEEREWRPLWGLMLTPFRKRFTSSGPDSTQGNNRASTETDADLQ